MEQPAQRLLTAPVKFERVGYGWKICYYYY